MGSTLRLRDEHCFPGHYTIVKDYVREKRLRTQEMFVPLVYCGRSFIDGILTLFLPLFSPGKTPRRATDMYPGS